MSVDWSKPLDQLKSIEGKKVKVVILWPGIGGDSSKGYIKSTCKHFDQKEDYVIGVIQGRGVNAPLVTPEFMSYDKLDDWD